MGLKTAPHRRHRGGARRDATAPASSSASRALGLEAARCCRARKKPNLSGLGVISAIPDAPGRRRRSRRRQPRADRGSRGGEAGRGGVAAARRAARRRRARAAKAIAATIRAGVKRRPAATPRAGDGAVSGRRLVPRARPARSADARASAADRPPAHASDARAGRRARADHRATSRSTRLEGAHRPVSSNRVSALPAGDGDPATRCSTCSGRRAVIVSAFGLREGLLYRDLDAATRAEDPLLAAALEVGERLGRFGDHGATLDAVDRAAVSRRRPAGAAASARGLPDGRFRAGMRTPTFAPSGRSTWRCTAIGSGSTRMAGRCSGGRLCAAFGGDGGVQQAARGLARPARGRARAAWGRAIRLAQRLSGGTEATLAAHRAGAGAGASWCCRSPSAHRGLVGEAVEQRLRQLAKALGRHRRGRGRLAAAGALDPVGGVEIDGQPVLAIIHRHHHARLDPADDARAASRRASRAPSSLRCRLAVEARRAASLASRRWSAGATATGGLRGGSGAAGGKRAQQRPGRR